MHYDRGRAPARIGALGALIASLLLARWFIAPPGAADVAGDSLVGPTSWPRAMLFGIAICAGLLLVRSFFTAERSASKPPPAEEFDNRKAMLGAALLVLYVCAIPVIGFAFATLVFFLLWLPYGGVRRPLLTAIVAACGTGALLYMFVKITTMPLDRGVGVFDTLTVGLYLLMGIY